MDRDLSIDGLNFFVAILVDFIWIFEISGFLKTYYTVLWFSGKYPSLFFDIRKQGGIFPCNSCDGVSVYKLFGSKIFRLCQCVISFTETQTNRRDDKTITRLHLLLVDLFFRSCFRLLFDQILNQSFLLNFCVLL